MKFSGECLWEAEYGREELDHIASRLLEKTGSGHILISGPMGAGKTTLISALSKELGSADEASSPTFGWVNSYATRDGALLAYHFDNYRIEDPKSVHTEELWEYYDQNVPVWMEWPEKLEPEQWPEEYYQLEITLIAEGGRRLRLFHKG